MNNPTMNPEDQQEIYIKAYPKVKWLSKDGRYIPDGIEGYVPIQVTNNLTDPKIAFSVVAKPSYIK